MSIHLALACNGPAPDSYGLKGVKIMQPPAGVVYRPRQKDLIAKDQPAVMQIVTGQSYPANDGYTIHDRVFEQAIAPYLHGDWADFDQLFQLNPRRVVSLGAHIHESPVIYSGAEHRGDPKLPNLTVVPNLSTLERRGLPRSLTVLGCTMGHYHPSTPHGSRTQEVYEFQSYGLIAVDKAAGEVELWVAREGDKVAVPTGCHMTLYNLGDEHNPLTTLDFADPDRNPSDKTLVQTCGPVLLIYYDDFQVTFVLNWLYVNNPEHAVGVQLRATPSEADRRITLPRAGRLDLGRFLYEALSSQAQVIGQLERLGLRIKPASPQVALEPMADGYGTRLYFSRPLAQAAVPGSEVYQFFKAGQPATASPRQKGAFDTVLARKDAVVRRRLALEPSAHAVILVQGAGEWVQGAYRPTFAALHAELSPQGRSLSVFYADDTSWRGARPAWTEALQPWEVYLDKSDPQDLARYRNVLSRVDVVIVATPDFTHAEIVRECLRKRVPITLVEKPFDSHIDNVEDLLQEMGRLSLIKAVLGLDHYMFYAAAVKDLMPQLQQHLGGALQHVAFYMTENKPIERERERTLQHGLMLDMLPHMLSMLAFFGDVSTVDDIRVLAAGQYQPLISQDAHGTQHCDMRSWYRNETYARLRFTFEDYPGNRVPCLGVVGKGFAAEVKYLEVTGSNGNAVRVDLVNRQPGAYPYDSIFLLAHPHAPPSGTTSVPDPYDSTRTLHILPRPQQRLDRVRYKKLLADLINGTHRVVANVLLLDEAYETVRALDRMWWAIQEARSAWQAHAVGTLQPVQPETV